LFVPFHTAHSNLQWSRTITQAGSPRLSSAAAWVRSQVKSCEFCGGQSGTGAGSLRVLRFPLPILIPLNYAWIRSSIPDRDKFAANDKRGLLSHECDPGLEADHSTQSSAEVRNGGVIPPVSHTS
jgi:hypothetical protein